MWGLRSASGLFVFCAKHYQKRLKSKEVNIYMFKVKKRPLEQGLKSFQSQQLGHQNDANFVVLVSLLLILNIFYTLVYDRGQN